MKKYLIILIIGLLSYGLTSCITPTHAETYIADEDVQVVIRYGTPYYYGGEIAYYMYNGYYFYPYRYNNSYRFYRYSRPLPHRYYGRPLPPPRHHGRPPMHRHNEGYKTHRHHPNANQPRNNGTFRHNTTPTNRPPMGRGGRR